MLNLTAEQLGLKVAEDLRQNIERRSKEQSDLSNSEAEAQIRREAVKLLAQEIDEANAKIDQAKSSEDYKEVMAVCLSSAVDPAKLRPHVTQMLDDSNSRTAAALHQLKEARDELDKEEANAPHLRTEDSVSVEHEEQSSQRLRLEAEAEISSFISKVGSHLPGSWRQFPNQRLIAHTHASSSYLT